MKVIQDEVEEKTKGGIILPATAREKAQQRQVTGTVVALGEDVEILKVGDRVLFGEYAGFSRREDENGNEIGAPNGIVYKYMNEGDAVAIYRGDK